MGITPHPSHRVGVDEDENEEKKQKEMVKHDGGIVKGQKGKDEKEKKTVEEVKLRMNYY